MFNNFSIDILPHKGQGVDRRDAYRQLIGELHQRSRHVGLRSGGQGGDPELASALRITGMIKLSYTIAAGVLARKESRGSHFGRITLKGMMKTG